MIRTCKMLAVAAVLAVFPLLATAGSGETKDVGKKVDELRAAIDALTRKVDALKSDANADKAALDEIRRRLSALERALETPPPPMNDRSKSLYPPAGAAVGRVQLRNEFAADVTLTLNDNTTIRIPAFQTRDVAGVPAGTLKYQVFVDGWGPGAAVFTTLQPSRTVSLVVR